MVINMIYGRQLVSLNVLEYGTTYNHQENEMKECLGMDLKITERIRCSCYLNDV